MDMQLETLARIAAIGIVAIIIFMVLKQILGF